MRFESNIRYRNCVAWITVIDSYLKQLTRVIRPYIDIILDRLVELGVVNNTLQDNFNDLSFLDTPEGLTATFFIGGRQGHIIPLCVPNHDFNVDPVIQDLLLAVGYRLEQGVESQYDQYGQIFLAEAFPVLRKYLKHVKKLAS